jgi:lipopolysaccharide biosynthesis glycosyltransferase
MATLFRLRNTGDTGASALGARVGSAARRSITRVGPLDRAARRVVERRRVNQRLHAMYQDLRSTFSDRIPEGEELTGGRVDAVAGDAVRAKLFGDFVDALCVDGDFDRAMVSTTRRLIERAETGRARSIAQTLQQYPDLRPIADICLAMCAYVEPMPETGWRLFSRNDLGLIMRWAAHEYFKLGFRIDPETAAASLGRVLSKEVRLDADPDIWLQIAYASFSAGYHDLAGQTVERGESALSRLSDAGRIERLRKRLSVQQEWVDRAGRARQPVEAPAGEIPFALVGFKHPDWRRISRDLDDPVETLTVLGHLLRHKGVQFSGDSGLVVAAERLRDDVPTVRRIGGEKAKVRLYEVDRDLSRYAAVPDGTWIVVSEWFTLPLGGSNFDMPLNPKLRPIFISFSITPRQLAAPGVVEYLRQCGPVGCREWDTVLLLHAAGVPAFFSGALVTTVDNVVPAVAPGPRSGTLFVDVDSDGRGQHRSRLSPDILSRELGDNLTWAARELRQQYLDSGAHIVTSDVRLCLAARALGGTAELRPRDLGDFRVADYLTLSDEGLESMRRGISDKLAATFGVLLAGGSEKEVYAAWAEACASDVAAAQAELERFPGHPALTFDIEEVCAAIRTASVTIERSQPGAAGPEINVEFSLDANYKHQLDIVLDSVVERCSRPVRAFVLCRGHKQADFDRMARLFPTVSFVWLPTDAVTFGRIAGLNQWVTAATLDRTTLPVLLGDVDRIIHFDLDALCVADLAEMFDVDMEGMALAAAVEPQPSYVGGYDTIRRTARRIRRENHPELAHEFLIRMTSRHPFDFDIFNAGIMLLNLEKMRADDFCGSYLPYLQRYGVNGQTVICIYVGRDYKQLDGDWNRLLRLEFPDTVKIAHWAGPYKPWPAHQYVSGRELWREQEVRFKARTAGLRRVG